MSSLHRLGPKSRQGRGAALGTIAGCLVALAAAMPAEAAFPGTDGPIAFNSNRDVAAGEIYSFTPGGPVARLTTSTTSSNPAYSPDGRRIAYISANPSGPQQVFLMNADGSGRTQLTTSPTAKTDPTWSPDGTRIAYVANSFDVDGGTDLEIWAIGADGTGRTQLTHNTNPDSQPAWSPSGDRIAFMATRPGDTNNNIYVMDADGTNEVSVTPNETGVCSPCYQGHDENPAWSPNGSKIAYVHGNGVAGGGLPDIWTMDPDGGAKLNVSDNTSVSFTQPAWSPEGDRLAAVGTAAATTNRDIWVMNADGSGQTPVSTGPAHDINPDWGPYAPPVAPPPDVAPPGLDVAAKKVQPLGRTLKVTAACDESCTVRATGKVIVRAGGGRAAAPRAAKAVSIRLKAASASLAARERRTLKLKLSKKSLKKLERAMRARGAKGTAKLRVSAADATGNETSEKMTVKLRG